MLYHCQFELRIQVSADVRVLASRRLEVALACATCQRTARTLILNQNEPGRHWSGPEHEFPGRLLSIRTEREGERTRVSYHLEYDFQPFVDCKYPDRPVEPQPSWGRIALQLTCPCGRVREIETQCNIGKPMTEVCACGSLLFHENEGALGFTRATPFGE